MSERHGRGVRLTRRVLIAGLAATTVLAAAPTRAAECEDPPALRFSIIPTEETIQELTIYKPVLDYLAEKTGKKIEFYMPTSYASVIEAMLGNWVDVAVHGPNSYVIGNEKSKNIEVFATYAKAKGHVQEEGPGYRAILITRKDSKYTDIASLEGAALALANPASTSGNLLPRVEFTKSIANRDLDAYFGKVIYSGGHDQSVMAVHEGRVDAAFVATHRFDNVVDRGLVKVEDFNVLWQSRVVPQDPFTYRAQLCPALKQKIRETFLTLHERPQAKAFLDNVKAVRFVEMSSEDYDIIRDLRAAKEKAKKGG